MLDLDVGYPVYTLWFSCSNSLLNYLGFESFDQKLFTLTYLSMFRLRAGGLLIPWSVCHPYSSQCIGTSMVYLIYLLLNF